MNLNLRPPQPDDAAAMGLICYEAFRAIAQRHGFPPDFPDAATATGLMQHMLSRADVYGIAAEVGGKVVGSNFLWQDEPVAGLGPITVDPAAQDGRVGRRLMEAVLQHAQSEGIHQVRLVQAAYHARSLSLYTQLGFDTREPLSLMQGTLSRIPVADRTVRPATEADLAAADALCHRVHDHARPGELRAALTQGTATVVEHAGRLSGYTTGIGFFGHAVAETTADLKALIAAASAISGPGFLLPTRNADLLRWSLQHGLRIVQPMTLMSLGPYCEPRGSFLPSILY